MKQDDVDKYLALKSELTNVEAKTILGNSCCMIHRNKVIAMNWQDPAKRSEILVFGKFLIWLKKPQLPEQKFYHSNNSLGSIRTKRSLIQNHYHLEVKI